MAVTLRDIARSLGLSHATVSFVLNERYDVAIPESTRIRVRTAAEQMGYRPNRAARALVKGRTQMLALWIPSLRNPYYAKVFHHLQSLCRDAGYETIYCEARMSKDVSSPYDWPVDGVIGVDAGQLIDSANFPANMPMVTIGAYVDESHDHVRFDLYDGALSAVRHLAEIGCERLAYVCVPSLLDDRGGRYAAFRKVVEEHRLSGELIVCENAAGATVREAVSTHVERSGSPDGVFCYNDWMAIPTVRGLKDAGVDIPKQTAVVGFDGLDIVEHLAPALTTVCQPVQEMAHEAFEMLKARIEDPKRPVQSLAVKAILARRESTER